MTGFDGRRRIRCLLVIGGVLVFQAPLAGQGIRRAGSLVFEKTCASIYCHGSRGLAGAAPAVAGKGLSQEQVNHIVSEGVANTNMAGWKNVLSATELAAVIDYVIGLQVSTRSQREALDPNRPWLRHAGRALFFDAGRIAPCGSCHEFDGLGLAVAPRFESHPSLSAAALRSLTSEKVRTVRPQDHGLFVGIAATSRAGLPRWYELRGQLPVLRTFAERPEDTGPASSWTHGDVTTTYSDDELEKTLEFVGEVFAAD